MGPLAAGVYLHRINRDIDHSHLTKRRLSRLPSGFERRPKATTTPTRLLPPRFLRPVLAAYLFSWGVGCFYMSRGAHKHRYTIVCGPSSWMSRQWSHCWSGGVGPPRCRVRFPSMSRVIVVRFGVSLGRIGRRGDEYGEFSRTPSPRVFLAMARCALPRQVMEVGFRE